MIIRMWAVPGNSEVIGSRVAWSGNPDKVLVAYVAVDGSGRLDAVPNTTSCVWSWPHTDDGPVRSTQMPRMVARTTPDTSTGTSLS